MSNETLTASTQKNATGQMARELTSIELRVRVAELSGPWTFESFQDYVIIKHKGNTILRYWLSSSDTDTTMRLGLAGIPDYPNDLNACHEFENATFGPTYYESGEENPLAIQYWLELRKLVLRKLPNNGWNCSEVDKVRATAEQRCKAFIATMEASSIPECPKSDTGTGASSPK